MWALSTNVSKYGNIQASHHHFDVLIFPSQCHSSTGVQTLFSVEFKHDRSAVHRALMF